MESLFRIFPAIIKEIGDDPQLVEPIVFALWPRIAGESVSEKTVPIKLTGKNLSVAVESELWKCNLQALNAEILYKLNTALGQATVSFIEFFVDEKAVRKGRRKENRKSKDSDDDRKLLDFVTPQMRNAADAIADDDLRIKFLLAAGSSLAHKETCGRLS